MSEERISEEELRGWEAIGASEGWKPDDVIYRMIAEIRRLRKRDERIVELEASVSDESDAEEARDD